MTIEIIQTNEGINAADEHVLVDSDINPDVATVTSTPEVEVDNWQSMQSKTANFFADFPEYIVTFFRNNRQIVSALGWVLLSVLGIKVLLAVLGTINDLPIIGFALKLIGLLSVVQFTRRYLMRAADREKLSEKIGQVKSELLGSQS